MASNPHSDFTTHNRTLPTLSNLPIFATHCCVKKPLQALSLVLHAFLHLY